MRSIVAFSGSALSALTLTSVVVLGGCPAKVATVEVTPAKVLLTSEADTKSFTATPKDADGNPIADKPVTWSSSDPAVATVTDGKVKPVGSGTAIITAKADEATGTGNVEVVLLKGVKLESPAIVIKAGAPNPPLKVAFTNEKGELIEGAGARVDWKSADPNIATVAADGAITGVAAGSTTVSAKVEGLSADVAVTVTPAEDAADSADAGPEGTEPAPTK